MHRYSYSFTSKNLIPIAITSVLFNCNSINGLRKFNGNPFGQRKFFPIKVQAKSLELPMPITATNLTTKSKDSLASFPFEEYRRMKVKQINKELDEAVPLQHPTKFHEAMRYTFLAGGKRIFPTLYFAASELVGGDEHLVKPMACAKEIITTMLVIQDDLPCLDNDDIRSGKPTNHKVFGEGTSVLACQALLCLAIQHFTTKTKNVISPDHLVRAIEEICSALGSEGISTGQFQDINSEGKQVSLIELEFIHMQKTGKFVEASVFCGALVGGGNEVEMQRSRKYGRCVGLAYQVWPEMGEKAERDSVRDRATYPKLIGVDESKKYARRLVVQAIEQLAYFDSTKVVPLHHMASFVISCGH